MRWIIGALMLATLFVGVQTLRAEEVSVREYAKVTCRASPGDASSVDQWPEMMHAYFPNAYSLRDVNAKYPERFAHLLNRCDQKRRAKAAVDSDRLPADWNEPRRHLVLGIEPLRVSSRQLGTFGEACARDEDCKSQSCDLQLGKCNLKVLLPALSVTH